MVWIDYRKAYDMILHSGITECLKMFGIAENVERFISHSVSEGKTELTSSVERLGHVQISTSIYH